MSIQKKLSTIFLSALIAVFLIQAAAATALFLTPAMAQAAGTVAYPPLKLQVPIPGLAGNGSVSFNGTTGPIAAYIEAIYAYAVGAVGIVAAVVLMIGGVMWITSGGNTSNVTEAKSMILASLTGMVLVLISYLLLNQINPALVNLQSDVILPPTQNAPAPVPTVSCDWTWGTGLAQIGTISGSSGKVYSADSLCPQPKPNHANTQCLCSYLKSPTLNCTWTDKSGDGACPAGNIAIGLTKPATTFDPEPVGNLAVIKECGSAGYGGANTCCCPPSPGNCNNCDAISPTFSAVGACDATKNVPCQANKDLLAKLQKFSADFTITGAWPPTGDVHVDNSCHDTGICVDLVATAGKFTQLSQELHAANFSFIQFECKPDGCCSNYSGGDSDLSGINCVVSARATGPHFHVKY